MKSLLHKLAIAGVGSLLVGGFALGAIGNDHTGFDSENNASVESENEAEVKVENDADLDNDVDGIMRTGYNFSDFNTGSGEVDSGDVEADVSATNMANESSVSVSVGSMGADLTSVTNSTTGAQSVNNAWIEFENSLEIEVENDADVDNDIVLRGTTGRNSSSYNTGNGSVSSGDASLTVSLDNTLNTSDVSVD